MPHRKHLHQRVGVLRDEPATIAEQIQRQASDFQTVAWVDDVGEIWATNSIHADGIPEHFVIGVYAFGVPHSDIVADVQALQHERMRNWISD
jgi:hypothetical protein